MKNSIKKNQTFQKIISQKKSISNEFFKIYFQKNNCFKFGIAVGKKKVNLAVNRNKIKRWVREIVNKHQIINTKQKIIIIVNINIDNIQFKIFEEKLSNLLNQLKG